jgi:tyrosyl-tRNA synthetase
MRSHALLDDLKWRGLLYQHTDEVGELLSSGPTSGYIGFDPTAPSLHIGSLLVIMLLVRLQRHGHIPVALAGGGTGLIGDPGGKTSERPLSDADTVAANTEAIRRQLERFLDFSGSNAARLVNNAFCCPSAPASLTRAGPWSAAPSISCATSGSISP